jgi:hypothetical protein
MKRHLLIIILLICLSVPTVKDLFHSGAYTSHDLTNHIVRTIHMDKILKEGQFPPRWIGDLNYGYGYPLFLFNYPLPSIIAVGIHHLGFNYIWSVKLTFALSMVSSALFAYILFHYLFKSRAAGLTGALFYLYAPIRFLNVYVSATFGNAVAFAFVPLIFWSLLKAYRGEFDNWSLLGGSLSLAGLILSHNIMALMFIPVVAAFALLLIFLKPAKTYLCQAGLALGLGLGLASFFLLPTLIEKKLIRYDAILPGFYKTHFPTLKQLIHSHWGYGFSHPGTEHDDMSFQIGLAHLLAVGLATVTLFFKRKHSRPLQPISLFFLILFGLTVFFMLEISTPLWEKIPLFPYIQMPWRLLAVSIFAASALAAFLASAIKPTPLVALILIVAVLVANRNHLRINQVFDPGEEYYFNFKGTTTMASEHLPKGAQKFDNFPPAESKINLLQGQAQINLRQNTSTQVKAQVKAQTPVTFRFNQVYFPGWQFYLDADQVEPLPVNTCFSLDLEKLLSARLLI